MSSPESTVLAPEGPARQAALDRLTAQCYAELRRIARRERRRGGRAVTLDTGGVVHEAFLRLAAQRHAAWGEPAPFLAAAAGAMRRVVVDHARRRAAAKRGAGHPWVTLDEGLGGALAAGAADRPGAPADDADATLLALDAALARLGTLAPRLARVVECRYFAGMTEPEVASALGVTERTVRRDWVKARGWLHATLAADP